MSPSDWIAIPQVARAMSVELSPREAWSIGSEVATLYQRRVGAQPTKDLRPKTSGSGSHCFAVYPPAWEKTIRAVIESHIADRRTQNDLFGD